MSEPRNNDEQVSRSGADEEEEAIETVAHLLRVAGRNGFDTANIKAEEAESRAEAWARHILIRAAAPGSVDSSAAECERDWKGLCRYASEKRRDEAEYVVTSISDLRETLWTFIQGLANTMPIDRTSNDAVTEQLERLRNSLNSEDTSELRRVASESIEVIDGEIRERIVRSEAQIEDLANEIKKVSDELMDARERLERDALTGLYNRGAFDEYLTKMSHLGMISGQTSTLMLIDVDDFKWVNDHAGHPAGDEVLKEISKCLMAGFSRRSDFVARYGGDEFAVLLNTEDESIDRELGEDMLYRIRDLSIPIGEEELRVTLSIGAARLRSGESREEWLERSDRALYRAKELGRDRLVCDFDSLE